MGSRGREREMNDILVLSDFCDRNGSFQVGDLVGKAHDHGNSGLKHVALTSIHSFHTPIT